MKHNPFDWVEVDPAKDIVSDIGRVQLRCSVECAFYVQVEGYETLVKVDTDLDLHIVAPAIIKLTPSGKGNRAFIYAPGHNNHEPQGVAYTRLDRAPSEGGTIEKIKRTLRKHQIEQQSERQAMRADMAELAKARAEFRQLAKKTESEPNEAKPLEEKNEVPAQSDDP